MASIVYNPTNQQPESVSVKTGAYTIPAGYYAYVTANVQGADTFSIGGVVALQGVAAIAQSLTTAAVSAVSSSQVTVSTAVINYTVPTGYYFIGQSRGFSAGGATNYIVSIGGVAAINFSTSSSIGVNGPFHAGSGDVVSVSVSDPLNSCSAYLSGVSIRPFSITTIPLGQTSDSGNFWVASGTALTTTGGSYTVTLYKNIV